MRRFVEVAKKSQVPEGGAIGEKIEGRLLGVVNLRGEIYELEDTCPHQAGPLSDGQIIGEDIECPWHRLRFNIKTHQGPSRGGRHDVQGAPRW